MRRGARGGSGAGAGRALGGQRPRMGRREVGRGGDAVRELAERNEGMNRAHAERARGPVAGPDRPPQPGVGVHAHVEVGEREQGDRPVAHDEVGVVRDRGPGRRIELAPRDHERRVPGAARQLEGEVRGTLDQTGAFGRRHQRRPRDTRRVRGADRGAGRCREREERDQCGGVKERRGEARRVSRGTGRRAGRGAAMRTRVHGVPPSLSERAVGQAVTLQ